MQFFMTIARIVTTGLLMALAGSAVGQQAYPNKPIRIVVPFPPGGSNNALARLLGQKLTESWGQPVVVDNRPGGNTIIGTDVVAKSPANGYTIMLVVSTHVITPLLLSTPYDPIKDFAPVATVDSSELVLVLHPSVPANTLREFVALAKSTPGQLNYATPGTGGVAHLATELFSVMTGVKMQHIPYKGGGPALTDLIGGQVQLYFHSLPSAIPHIKSGKLRPIAVSGETRSPVLPLVPTFSEAGLPAYEAKFWHGVLAPAGTPKEIIDKLSTEIARILAMPDIKEKLASQGTEPFISSAEQFATLMKIDMARYARVIKAANIRIE